MPTQVKADPRPAPQMAGGRRASRRTYGRVASMSRAGDRWDSALAESLFATLSAEWVEQER